MVYVRLLLVVVMAFFASVSGAVDVSHAVATEQAHVMDPALAGDQPSCCDEGAERMQNCQMLQAVLPLTDVQGAAPTACVAIVGDAELLRAGFEPAGPLDPPRAA